MWAHELRMVEASPQLDYWSHVIGNLENRQSTLVHMSFGMPFRKLWTQFLLTEHRSNKSHLLNQYLRPQPILYIKQKQQFVRSLKVDKMTAHDRLWYLLFQPLTSCKDDFMYSHLARMTLCFSLKNKKKR